MIKFSGYSSAAATPEGEAETQVANHHFAVYTANLMLNKDLNFDESDYSVNRRTN